MSAGAGGGGEQAQGARGEEGTQGKRGIVSVCQLENFGDKKKGINPARNGRMTKCSLSRILNNHPRCDHGQYVNEYADPIPKDRRNLVVQHARRRQPHNSKHLFPNLANGAALLSCQRAQTTHRNKKISNKLRGGGRGMLRSRCSTFQWLRDSSRQFARRRITVSSRGQTNTVKHPRMPTLTLDRAIIAPATSSALIEGLIVAYCPL